MNKAPKECAGCVYNQKKVCGIHYCPFKKCIKGYDFTKTQKKVPMMRWHGK